MSLTIERIRHYFHSPNAHADSFFKSVGGNRSCEICRELGWTHNVMTFEAIEDKGKLEPSWVRECAYARCTNEADYQSDFCNLDSCAGAEPNELPKISTIIDRIRNHREVDAQDMATELHERIRQLQEQVDTLKAEIEGWKLLQVDLSAAIKAKEEAENDSDRRMIDVVTRLNTAESERDALRQQVAELTGWLAECFKLTGADVDGNEDWR